MKRSDVTTAITLTALITHGLRAWEHLTETYPAKVVLAAYEREHRRGNIDYGCTLRLPWITPKGIAHHARGEAGIPDADQYTLGHTNRAEPPADQTEHQTEPLNPADETGA
ncbi:hypothetical protein [Streptomyces sp. NPDC059278]|uniref:hypothetical protein n=1 Tax=Streptomyces sp. NPDC059278 TaxID=3346801 RepID=UPI0036BF5584